MDQHPPNSQPASKLPASTNSSQSQEAPAAVRPECMIVLGLLAPYSVEDVQAAYREKARSAHPDRGGSAAQFALLNEAYEQALEYTRFMESRREWLGPRIAEYICREAVADEVQRRGGTIVYKRFDWLNETLGGDFAQVVETIASIRLAGPQVGDDAIDALLNGESALRSLYELDLSGSRISDQAAGRLGALTGLRRINLSGTGISNRGLKKLRALPDLEWLHLDGTRVNWWGRLRFRRALPEVELVGD